MLFVFDPRECAILLLGGDKTGLWKRWYHQAIQQAEKIYAKYLNDLKREGIIK